MASPTLKLLLEKIIRQASVVIDKMAEQVSIPSTTGIFLMMIIYSRIQSILPMSGTLVFIGRKVSWVTMIWKPGCLVLLTWRFKMI